MYDNKKKNGGRNFQLIGKNGALKKKLKYWKRSLIRDSIR